MESTNVCFTIHLWVLTAQLWNHAGYQFDYNATDTPMYNTMTTVCVWEKSGPVRITIVVAQISIFNGYLFVMDIK